MTESTENETLRRERKRGRSVLRGGGMVRLVREGLQSIRDGLDHTPVAATRYYASFFEQWHEILVGAFAAYVSKRTIIVEGTISEFSEGIGSFMALWAHLNTEVDIEIQDLHSCVTCASTRNCVML